MVQEYKFDLSCSYLAFDLLSLEVQLADPICIDICILLTLVMGKARHRLRHVVKGSLDGFSKAEALFSGRSVQCLYTYGRMISEAQSPGPSFVKVEKEKVAVREKGNSVPDDNYQNLDEVSWTLDELNNGLYLAHCCSIRTEYVQFCTVCTASCNTFPFILCSAMSYLHLLYSFCYRICVEYLKASS